jgi:hypothetical protein
MNKQRLTRRGFLGRGTAAVAAPLFINSRVFGANVKIVMAGIGMGGQAYVQAGSAGKSG